MSSFNSNSTVSINGAQVVNSSAQAVTSSVDIVQSSVSTISPVTWRKVVNYGALTNGGEYYCRTMDLFGDYEYVKGILTITDHYDPGPFGQFSASWKTYTINGISVHDNIWLQIPVQPLIGGGDGVEVTWRQVVNYGLLENGREYYYRVTDLFGDPIYRKGILTITDHYDPGPFGQFSASWKTYTINGISVHDNIWLPRQ
jgi:hypothetical protein